MLKKVPLFAAITAAVGALAIPMQASAHDPVAGLLIGGGIGAAVGGPPGAAVGAFLGAIIGAETHHGHGPAYRGHGNYAPGYDSRYAPQAYAPEPTYYAPPAPVYEGPVRYAAPRAYYSPPVHYAPPPAYRSARVYAAPRHDSRYERHGRRYEGYRDPYDRRGYR